MLLQGLMQYQTAGITHKQELFCLLFMLSQPISLIARLLLLFS